MIPEYLMKKKYTLIFIDKFLPILDRRMWKLSHPTEIIFFKVGLSSGQISPLHSFLSCGKMRQNALKGQFFKG